MSLNHTEITPERTPPLKFLRYVLSGGLAFVALVGIAEGLFGVPAHIQYDVYGAIVGFTVVAVGAKYYHFV